MMRSVLRKVVPQRVRRSRAIAGLRNQLSRHGWAHDWIYSADYFAKTVEGPAVESASDIANTIVTEFAPRSVADVGCGTGALLDAIRKRGCDVFGFEYSKVALDYCRRRNLPVAKFDVERDGLHDARTFDVVVSMEVAEHLPETAADRYLDYVGALGTGGRVHGGDTRAGRQRPRQRAAAFVLDREVRRARISHGRSVHATLARGLAGERARARLVLPQPHDIPPRVLMSPRDLPVCELTSHSLQAHLQQIYTGFLMLHRSGELRMRQRVVRDHAPREGPQHVRAARDYRLSVRLNGRTQLEYDVHDSWELDEDRLARAHLYFKRSYAPERLTHLSAEARAKVRPRRIAAQHPARVLRVEVRVGERRIDPDPGSPGAREQQPDERDEPARHARRIRGFATPARDSRRERRQPRVALPGRGPTARLRARPGISAMFSASHRRRWLGAATTRISGGILGGAATTPAATRAGENSQ